MQFLIKTLPKLRALRIRSASRFTKTLLFQCSYRFYSTTQQDLLSKPRVKEASDKMLKAFNIVETSQNFKDSRRLLEESIAVLEEELPRNHALLGLAYNNLAQVLMRLHFMNYTLEDDSVYTYKEIIPLFETALKIFEEQTDNENFEFLQKRTILLNSFGVYYLENLGDPKMGIKKLQQAEQLWKEFSDKVTASGNFAMMGMVNLFMAKIKTNLGLCHMQLKEHKKALPYYEQAKKLMEGSNLSRHPEYFAVLNLTAECQFNLGNRKECEELSKKVLQYVEGKADMELAKARALSNVGNVYYAEGKRAEAKTMYEKSIFIFEKLLPPSHPSLMWAYTNLALTLKSLNEDPQRVQELFDKAKGIAELTKKRRE